MTAAHWLDLRRMDENEQFMALLGGVRDKAGTVAYLEMNVKHWADHGFGMWMLRDAASSAVIGRAILRHLDVEGVDEVEVGYGFMPDYWGRGLATEIAQACVRIGFDRLGLSLAGRDHHAAEPRLTARDAESRPRLRARHRSRRCPASVVPHRRSAIVRITLQDRIHER